MTTGAAEVGVVTAEFESVVASLDLDDAMFSINGRKKLMNDSLHEKSDLKLKISHKRKKMIVVHL